jgi:hypothetical protein
MDPDENLRQQRALAARLIEATENGREVSEDDVLELSELVVALDNWMAAGGLPPDAWRTR